MKVTSKQKDVISLDDPITSDIPANTENIHTYSGSKHQVFTNMLLDQVAKTTWTNWEKKEDQETVMFAALVALKSVEPQNELEGMLGAQMVALHHAAMECFRRAMIPGTPPERRYENLAQANKLTRSYAALLESLQRYRGKGMSQQKVTVEHIHINEGAQAIIGNIEPKK